MNKYISIDWSKQGDSDKSVVGVVTKTKDGVFLLGSMELLSSGKEKDIKERCIELIKEVKRNLPADSIMCNDAEILKLIRQVV